MLFYTYIQLFTTEVEASNLKPESIHYDVPKIKKPEEIRFEPPVPVEPVVNSNVKVRNEEAVKVDVGGNNGNTISKDAIKKEDEELEKRPELEILEKLKSHENEEKKILAESKQILEELKGARQMQQEKTIKKPVDNYLKDVNLNAKKQENINPVISSKKNQINEVVKDKLPIPLALKEANKSNKTNIEISRDKRDLTSTAISDNDENEENCKKNESIKNDKFIEKVNVEN